MTKKLKRAVIKEELVDLTGGFVEALILDALLQSTLKIQEHTGKNKKIWIDKKAKELSEELMLGMSKQTIRKYISRLVSAGYVAERNNPENDHDRTKQYRVDMDRVLQDLLDLGYTVKDFLLAREVY